MSILLCSFSFWFSFTPDIHGGHHQPTDWLLRGLSPGAWLCPCATVRQNDGALCEQGPGGGDVSGLPCPWVWSADLLQLPEWHLLRVCQRNSAGWWAAPSALHLQVSARTAFKFSFISFVELIWSDVLSMYVFFGGMSWFTVPLFKN